MAGSGRRLRGGPSPRLLGPPAARPASAERGRRSPARAARPTWSGNVAAVKPAARLQHRGWYSSMLGQAVIRKAVEKLRHRRNCTPENFTPGGLGSGAIQDGEVIIVDRGHCRLVSLCVQQALPRGVHRVQWHLHHTTGWAARICKMLASLVRSPTTRARAGTLSAYTFHCWHAPQELTIRMPMSPVGTPSWPARMTAPNDSARPM